LVLNHRLTDPQDYNLIAASLRFAKQQRVPIYYSMHSELGGVRASQVIGLAEQMDVDRGLLIFWNPVGLIALSDPLSGLEVFY